LARQAVLAVGVAAVGCLLGAVRTVALDRAGVRLAPHVVLAVAVGAAAAALAQVR
jgi:hypothetical protein